MSEQFLTQPIPVLSSSIWGCNERPGEVDKRGRDW